MWMKVLVKEQARRPLPKLGYENHNYAVHTERYIHVASLHLAPAGGARRDPRMASRSPFRVRWLSQRLLYFLLMIFFVFRPSSRARKISDILAQGLTSLPTLRWGFVGWEGDPGDRG